jgi:polyisoprenoid-binding protein YceI
VNQEDGALKKLLVTSLISLFFAASLYAAVHTVKGEVAYTASGSTGSWSGTNQSISGNIETDPVGGSICIKMSKWDSKNARRDNHARDMFEVEKFPKACFHPVEVSGNTISGDMEVHGVKKKMSIPGKVTLSAAGFRFEGSTTIGIEDFGMSRPSIMGMKVNNEVKVEIKVSGGGL